MQPGFTQHLLDWYAVQQRSLPWRGHPDAYAVWISEIMLQQTRVETVIPYFERWMECFPTLADLAAAEQQAVLKQWEGLGYYSRARNLHKAAQQVMEKFGGIIPQDLKSLRSLPGVGRYTAAAIASMAFGVDAAALDGNIRRVLARLFDVSIPARSAQGEKRLWELAQAHLPPGRAGEYNQALMDLGALICTPKNPNCAGCPIAGDCLAYRRGVQHERPVLEARAETPHYTVTAAVIQRGDKVLIARRPQNGLLGGLWEFPGGKLEDGEALEACLKREILEELQMEIEVRQPFGIYQHAFTHFRITLHAFLCAADGEPAATEASAVLWVYPHELGNYPMGKVDRQIARKILGKQKDNNSK